MELVSNEDSLLGSLSILGTMGKSKQDIEGLKSLKTTVPQVLHKAVKAIYESSGRSESDVVREAVIFYIKKNYPEFLPKSKIEIENKFREDYIFETQYPKYRSKEIAKESLPQYEKYLKDYKEKEETLEGEIGSIEAQINMKPIPKNDKEKKLKEQLNTKLNEKKSKLEGVKTQIVQYENLVDNAKLGLLVGVPT